MTLYPWGAIPKRYRNLGDPPDAVIDKAEDVWCNGSASGPQPILTIAGPVGTGKSCLAGQTAEYFCKQWSFRHDQVMWHQAMQMGWDRDHIKDMATVKIKMLVLDDVSAGLTLAAITNLLCVLEYRSSRDLCTIITTTLGLVAMAEQEIKVNAGNPGHELGLCSRIAGGSMITLTGIDRRLALGDDAKMKASNDP